MADVMDGNGNDDGNSNGDNNGNGDGDEDKAKDWFKDDETFLFTSIAIKVNGPIIKHDIWK